MSKPVKELIRKELLKRFDGVDSLAVVSFTGIDAITTNMVRGRLAEKKIRLTVVKNALARQAFKEMGIESAAQLLEGPCAVAYGADSVVSVVREMLAIRKDLAARKKDAPTVVVKGAFMEGTVFPADQVEALSKFPTRDEAIATVVACIIAPASKLAACIKAPGGKVAALIKAVEEKAPAAEAAAPAPEAAAAPAPDAPAASAPEAPAAPAAEAAAPPTA